MAQNSMKNILIVGASSGIGLVLKNKLETEGNQVFTAGRREVSSAGHIHFDANSSSSFSFPDHWPDIFHGLVYSPGTINLKPIQRLNMTDFQTDFQVNVLGFVQVLQAILPRMKKANGASVVVFSTVAAQVGLGFHGSIAASKGALQSLAVSLAAELASALIRVNVVAPSLTQTPLASSLLSTPEKLAASAHRHPLQRIGTADDVASAAAYFIGEESSWVTGQILSVDGGLGIIR